MIPPPPCILSPPNVSKRKSVNPCWVRILFCYGIFMSNLTNVFSITSIKLVILSSIINRYNQIGKLCQLQEEEDKELSLEMVSKTEWKNNLKFACWWKSLFNKMFCWFLHQWKKISFMQYFKVHVLSPNILYYQVCLLSKNYFHYILCVWGVVFIFFFFFFCFFFNWRELSWCFYNINCLQSKKNLADLNICKQDGPVLLRKIIYS